jgi:hypothetical protein
MGRGAVGYVAAANQHAVGEEAWTMRQRATTLLRGWADKCEGVWWWGISTREWRFCFYVWGLLLETRVWMGVTDGRPSWIIIGGENGVTGPVLMQDKNCLLGL